MLKKNILNFLKPNRIFSHHIGYFLTHQSEWVMLGQFPRDLI
jgi:hypothetical protein